MKEIKFEWDSNKNKANFQKHKITFEEAQTVFYDENAVQYFDEEHSSEEDRLFYNGWHELSPENSIGLSLRKRRRFHYSNYFSEKSYYQ